ncbi:glycoside hydrolase family 2, sugar binding [Acidisarcina polymorpha]|uniref:Glycoside hydrolase family 2, sugar binding n=1 Tax=Acidisarcina polymorpha TaxID=2211140 RepID=A0A2Z5G0B9_9BACT|nr:glycoside hydrolase family 2, sugar binding [Acidisarcina polymorpha]
MTSLSVGALPFVGLQGYEGMSGLASRKSIKDVSLYEIFREPANQYRPMVRWWWNGDRVVGEEILRELDVLQAAGIGGVEINLIRFPAEADPMNTKALTWMSDEWIQVLKVALKGTKERGMTCDMIVGSGWPYGGEFLSREDQTQMVALGTKNFTGPAQVRMTRAELLDGVNPALVSPYKDSEKELFGLTLVPSPISTTADGIRLNEQVRDENIEFDVPAGDHVLYFLVKLTGFMAVINGAPGATGPVLNHYSEQAVARYLDRLSTRLSAKIGPLGDHFRAFFTDSIELEGANWCDDMFAEFRKRRGYDLSPWLPFVLFKVGEMGNAVTEEYGAKFSAGFKAQTDLVRYDFETTKHELFQERFVGTFAEWCKRNGVKSRMQAYGMELDAITAGMMLDIPECETWIRSEKIEDFGTGDYRQGRSYTMINKFVSSAAHLSGKQLISCEEMTNTDDPFHASLERIKLAGDQSMLSGVTQSVLHGFNYSPADAPFPGWVRYGTYFSERNTWWPYFKLWVDYKSRLSALFQQSVMQADIAILPPFADLASKYGFQRDPFPKTVDPPYLYKLWEVVHQNGSGCDYLTEDIIHQSTVGRGRLLFRDRSYKAIFLPDVESLHLITAKQLKKFVESGGTLLCIGNLPRQASGLVNNASESLVVHEVFQSLRKSYPLRTAVLHIDEQNLVNWYRDLQKNYALTPDVSIDRPTDFISQLHYVSGSRDVFFFSNYGPEETHTFEATVSLPGKTPWLWNPESGERAPYPTSGSKNVLSITLGPSESRLIVFEPSSIAADTAASVEISDLLPAATAHPRYEQIIPGPWNLKLIHVNGTTQSRVVEALVDLSQQDDLKSFAGTMIYSNRFQFDHHHQRVIIDLGHLHSVSQLEINGRHLGTRWYGVHTYDVSNALTSGRNEITIRVVSTLGDYMKFLLTNKTAQVWSRDTPLYPLGLTQSVRLLILP